MSLNSKTILDLKLVVCNPEESEKDPGELAQILMKVPHTSVPRKSLKEKSRLGVIEEKQTLENTFKSSMCL